MSDALPLLGGLILTLVLIFIMFFVGGIIALVSHGLRFIIHAYFVVWLGDRILDRRLAKRYRKTGGRAPSASERAADQEWAKKQK